MGNLFKKLAGLQGAVNKFSRPAYPASEAEENLIEEMTDEEIVEEIEEELEEDLAEAEEERGAKEDTEEWNEYDEGQLSIDVYQTPEAIIVKSTIAGVKPENLDISINNDLLTIRGKREMQKKIPEKDYLFKECYWGPFSRSIILPVEIEEDKIEAVLENGVLTITLPKTKSAKQIAIKVKEK